MSWKILSHKNGRFSLTSISLLVTKLLAVSKLIGTYCWQSLVEGNIYPVCKYLTDTDYFVGMKLLPDLTDLTVYEKLAWLV